MLEGAPRWPTKTRPNQYARLRRHRCRFARTLGLVQQEAKCRVSSSAETVALTKQEPKC